MAVWSWNSYASYFHHYNNSFCSIDLTNRLLRYSLNAFCCLCVCLFVGQVMSPYHSDQISQRSHVSRVTLYVPKSKVWLSQSVSQSVTEWVSEWQGHLLSCFGQLEMRPPIVFQTCLNQTWIIIGLPFLLTFVERGVETVLNFQEKEMNFNIWHTWHLPPK